MENLVEMRAITKSFGGVTVLRDVDFLLRPGEVHALVGENGAGKSTLIKILSGAHRADSGKILVGGQDAVIASPLDSERLGIKVIYQEFNLAKYLSVAENIFLGHWPKSRCGRVQWRKMYAQAAEVLNSIGFTIDVRRRVGSLSVAQQQMVEIAKALSGSARVLVMDEPSAVLSEKELAGLFQVIRRLAGRGVGIVYISHRLDEVLKISDRITVLRDGENVGVLETAATTKDEVVRRMVGRSLSEMYPARHWRPGRVILEVKHLSGKGFADVSFVLRTGEILGLAGLVGSGRTEVVRSLFGADRKTAGQVVIDGRTTEIGSPRQAIAHGLGFLTEDRKQQGLVLPMTIEENMVFTCFRRVSRLGFVISRKRRRELATRHVSELNIRTPSVGQLVRRLSGGNQQKVVLAKWLSTEARIVIFDEPTRGIDVGAKAEIYKLMADLAQQGVGIIMISSELPEVLGMCDRVLVMQEGRIAGELTRESATEQAVMRLATGAGVSEATGTEDAHETRTQLE